MSYYIFVKFITTTYFLFLQSIDFPLLAVEGFEFFVAENDNPCYRILFKGLFFFRAFAGRITNLNESRMKRIRRPAQNVLKFWAGRILY